MEENLSLLQRMVKLIKYSVFCWLNHEFVFPMAMMLVECKIFIRIQMDHEQNINKFGRLNNRFHELEVEIKVAKTIKKLESAIVASLLGLSPKVDGERLIAVIPPLTKEHIQAMCKVVTNSCEDCRQSIRRARQKAMDTTKKLYSHALKDDVKKLEKEVDELTKKFVKSAEDMCKAKEKEITGG